MTAYAVCDLHPTGEKSCRAPSGATWTESITALDLPQDDLVHLTELTAAAGDARQRGDAAETDRLTAERDTYQRDALARMRNALEGHRSDEMQTRFDDPKTDCACGRKDADADPYDEDAAERRARRRDAVTEGVRMGLTAEEAGGRFDRAEQHRQAQERDLRDAAMRRAADRDSGDGGAW